jgi:hypothetical protein
VSEDALDAVPPSLLLQWTRSVGDPQADTRAFSGSDLHVAAVDEHAHLRFLVGAGVAPAQAVSFVESASRIGAWGMPVTRALAQQLAQDGLSLLPLPRPPKSLVTAAASGHFALEETRLNLFMSRVLRQLRASAGEPVAVLSVHAGGEVRLGLSSIFDSAVLHGFRWRLGLFDDLDEVVDVLLTLLRDCRIPDVRIVPGLQPACDAQGTAHFLSIHDLGPSDEVRR